ncbi:MAG: response regulator transcription factor [Cyanobacteria bacterium]|nr:response regulator transcription factor [Cyanobacteriota bacterium]
MARILLVEDDEMHANVVQDWLRSEKHIVDIVGNGAEGLEMIRLNSYDVIILDWELPEMTGFEILRKARSEGCSSPILMLTGRKTLDDKESGFEAGADDYLTKPFEIRELGARIKALLRRPAQFTADRLQVGNIQLDRTTFEVLAQGHEVKLSPKEFSLLEYFMRHPRQVFSAETIMEQLYKFDDDITVMAIRVHMSRLRKKLGEHMSCPISTVHGVGYILDQE